MTLTFLLQRTIRHHLRRSRPETMLNVLYSSEYTSGFPGHAASHLAAPPSPRHKSNVRQTPSLRSSETGETCGKGAIRSSGFEVPETSNFGPRTLARHASHASRAPRQGFVKKSLEIVSTFDTVRVGSA